MLTVAQFTALQQYLIQAYAPFIVLFVLGLVVAGVGTALLSLFLVLSRELIDSVLSRVA